MKVEILKEPMYVERKPDTYKPLCSLCGQPIISANMVVFALVGCSLALHEECCQRLGHQLKKATPYEYKPGTKMYVE
jgi:hypothetical protein